MRILYILILCHYFIAVKAQSWHALGDGLNSSVEEIVVEGNLVYAGGWFTNAGGHAGADFLALWDGHTWQPVASGLNHVVYAIAIKGNDIFVGGSFTNAGGNPNADYVARWDGSAWHSLGNGLNQTVFELAFQGDHLYAGGKFTDAGDDPEGDFIAMWDGNNWHAMSTGGSHMTSIIWSIATTETDVYVGGNFHTIGQVSNTRSIARWDGTNWHPLGNGFWGDMGAIDIHLDGNNVYVGGDGGPIGISACGIGRWDGDSWHSLGNGLSNCIYGEGGHAIEVLNESVYVGGVFEHAGIENTTGIAQWKQDAWNALGEPQLQWGLSYHSVYALATKDNNLYVGGSFDTLAGIPGANYIARWEEAPISSIESGSSIFPNNIHIFPNPVKDIINIQSDDENISITRLELIDVSGKTVHSQDQFTSAISVEHLSPGVYFLKISVLENVHTMLLLKE